jgi:hypothetical protein
MADVQRAGFHGFGKLDEQQGFIQGEAELAGLSYHQLLLLPFQETEGSILPNRAILGFIIAQRAEEVGGVVPHKVDRLHNLRNPTLEFERLRFKQAVVLRILGGPDLLA